MRESKPYVRPRSQESEGDVLIGSNRQVLSERLVLRNASNSRIIAFHDHEANWSNRPFVIIPPAYGETKKDHISLAYYLVVNGFNVIRYDNTNNLGESDGTIEHASLRSMLNDLHNMLDAIVVRFGVNEAIVIGTSLAGRVAMKLAAKDKRIRLLVLLMAVVNVRDTLREVYREDIVGEYLNGKRWGRLDNFGHEIEDAFVGQILADSFSDLESSIEDLRRVKAPKVFFAAERDAWISFRDICFLKGQVTNLQVETIPGALHQLQENPRLAREVMRKLVLVCKCEGLKTSVAHVVFDPPIHDIVYENKREQQDLKQLSVITKSGERDFWDDYLRKFTIILRSPDYLDMMSCMDSLLGHPESGAATLDAGCGAGHYGVWFLSRLLETSRVHTSKTRGNLTYIGVDYVYRALEQARETHRPLLNRLSDLKIGIPAVSYINCDLEQAVPFAEDQFERICCNLVISYLQKPRELIGELVRVLKRDGKLIVSSLKPFCDLSLIFRNFIEANGTSRDLEEAKALLSNTGQIRLKESEGHYHFYTEQELQDLFESAGLRRIRVFRTLGNQANIVVGVK